MQQFYQSRQGWRECGGNLPWRKKNVFLRKQPARVWVPGAAGEEGECLKYEVWWSSSLCNGHTRIITVFYRSPPVPCDMCDTIGSTTSLLVRSLNLEQPDVFFLWTIENWLYLLVSGGRPHSPQWSSWRRGFKYSGCAWFDSFDYGLNGF